MTRQMNRTANMQCMLILVLPFLLMVTGCSLHKGTSDRYQSDSTYQSYDSGRSYEQSAPEDNTGMFKRLSSSAKAAVDKEYRAYLNGAGRKTIALASRRSEKYLAFTKKTFREHGLPEDLAYLAIVESSYNPTARSRVGAAGAWQFMPFTGMKFGLNQDQWQDERLDIYKATEAAAQYLKILHERFGDWGTAIAAYNAGEGKLGRACNAANAKNFFQVCDRNAKLDPKLQLKEETRRYVPKFMAVTSIMKNLESHGFKEIHPENAPVMTRVSVKPCTDLKAMASACQMNWGEFSANNPHQLTPISHRSLWTNIYVPMNASEMAIAFAKKNPLLKSSTMVAPADSSSAQQSGRLEARSAGGKGKMVRLEKGQNLSSVARENGTTLEALMAANNIKNPHLVSAGQSLRIPGAGTVRDMRARTGSTGRLGAQHSYQVQSNDNLWRISKKFNVSVDDLKRWNNLGERQLRAGQNLVVMAK